MADTTVSYEYGTMHDGVVTYWTNQPWLYGGVGTVVRRTVLREEWQEYDMRQDL